MAATSLAALASCTSLPDTSGYTAASYQLKSAATAAGGALETELSRTAEQLPAKHRVRAQELAARFEVAWGKTVTSLDGLASYAASIEEVVKAGNSGGESADEVADKAFGLAEAVGLIPGANLAGVARDAFRLLNTTIANIRATRSLKRSLMATDPFIADISNVVREQLAAARVEFDEAIKLQRTAVLDFSVDDIAPVDAELARQEAEAELTFAALSANISSTVERRRAAAAELERIRSGRAALAPRMAAYNEAVAALAERERAGRELFDATDAALATWRENHAKVVRAINERRPVSFESLKSAGEQIRDLIERGRQL